MAGLGAEYTSSREQHSLKRPRESGVNAGKHMLSRRSGIASCSFDERHPFWEPPLSQTTVFVSRSRIPATEPPHGSGETESYEIRT